jgi:PilZ domain
MLLALGTRLDPYTLVALDIVFQRSPQPIQALGEVHWVRGGKGGQEQEVGIEFIVMEAQERARLIEEIYASP